MKNNSHVVYFQGTFIDLFHHSDIEETEKMLKRVGVDTDIIQSGGQEYTQLSINEARYRNITTRKAGVKSHIRKPDSFQEINRDDPALMSVNEIRRNIEMYGSVKTAQMMNISRATLFRMLKKAKEEGEKWVK